MNRFLKFMGWVKPSGRIINYSDHRGWGDSFHFSGPNKIVGWLTPLPEYNDEFRVPMKSGKLGRFRVNSVEQEIDPPDMFYATVRFVGYVGEV